MAKQASRSYSDRTLKILWGRAAGRCAVPTCRVELLVDATDHDPIVLIGDIAHIEAASDKGPRANQAKKRKERDDYDNLILLCKNCHFRLDGQKNSNTVEAIRKLRDDHESWVRNSLPERGGTTTGWVRLVLQGAHPFDLQPTVAALIPDFPEGDPIVLKADPAQEPWEVIHGRIVEMADQLFAAGDPFDFRLAVFPLAPVSACLGLGYYLTNRPRVRLFQYHRDDHSWAWFDDPITESDLTVEGIPGARDEEPGELAFCFHVGAPVEAGNLAKLAIPFRHIVHFRIPAPGTDWLRRKDQLTDLAKKARKAFEACLSLVPNATRWHIFYAGPAPGGVAVGQQLNPTMSPRVQFYEFRMALDPPHQPSFQVG